MSSYGHRDIGQNVRRAALTGQPMTVTIDHREYVVQATPVETPTPIREDTMNNRDLTRLALRAEAGMWEALAEEERLKRPQTRRSQPMNSDKIEAVRNAVDNTLYLNKIGEDKVTMAVSSDIAAAAIAAMEPFGVDGMLDGAGCIFLTVDYFIDGVYGVDIVPREGDDDRTFKGRGKGLAEAIADACRKARQQETP